MEILCLALTAFYIILIVRVVFSWIPRPPGPLVPVADAAATATDWAVVPLRNALPPVRLGSVALDLSVIVLFFAVSILRSLVC